MPARIRWIIALSFLALPDSLTAGPIEITSIHRSVEATSEGDSPIHFESDALGSYDATAARRRATARQLSTVDHESLTWTGWGQTVVTFSASADSLLDVRFKLTEPTPYSISGELLGSLSSIRLYKLNGPFEPLAVEGIDDVPVEFAGGGLLGPGEYGLTANVHSIVGTELTTAYFDFDLTWTPVPEPTSIVLAVAGLAAFALHQKLRRRRA